MWRGFMNDRIVKKSAPIFFIAIGVLLISTIFFACSNQTILQDTAPVTLDLTMHEKSMPVSILSIGLEVSGDGMDTISEELEADDEDIALEVPAGEGREFALEIEGPTGSFSGSVSEDLTPGEEVDITIPISILETKIYIPDAQNNRLIQVDNISGDNWIELTASGIAGITSFRPYDVGFDSKGRIYVANYTSADGENGIIRLDNISGSNSKILVPDSNGYEKAALAIDRRNEIVYFLNETSFNTYRLEKCDYNGNNHYIYDSSPDFNTFSADGIGIDVDSEGMLYIAFGTYVYKIDPSGVGILEESSSIWENVWDVVKNGGYTYIAELGGDGPPAIFQLGANLSVVDSLTEDPENPSDTLYGPHRFLATLNNKITIIDEDEFSTLETERIVSFSNISGSDWESFDPSQVGETQFDFYSFC